MSHTFRATLACLLCLSAVAPRGAEAAEPEALCLAGRCTQPALTARDPDDPTAGNPFRPGRPRAPKPFFPAEGQPQFVVYWVASDGPPGCPDDEPCLAVRRSEKALLDLVPAWRHERRLEIVRFDAVVGPLGSVWAGVWQRSGRRHRLELDLNWGTFLRHQHRRVRRGDELVHLKLYEVDGRQRVAAIWRPRSADDPGREHILRAHDWQTVERRDEKERRRGFQLSEIEAYPRPDDPDDDRWAAAVWREGEVETRLLSGLECDDSHDAPLEDEVPSPLLPGAVDSHVYSRCQLLAELAEHSKEGFQAVDFENYTEGGRELWAVLLEKRSGPDWLQFAGRASDVDSRERTLDAGAAETSFQIMDLDIYGLTTLPEIVSFHNGVVHDGSTSGPP